MGDVGVAEARFRELLSRAAQMFYSHGEWLVMEALLHAPRQPAADGGPSEPEWQLDEAIAARLDLMTRQVRSLLARLTSDRLVVRRQKQTSAATPDFVGARVEAAMPTADSVVCYYGVHFDLAADAIRFKLYDIEQMMEKQLREIEQEQGFICPNCSTKISALEMNNSLLHPETGEPCCPNPCCLDQTLDPEMNLQQMEEFEAKRQTVRDEVAPLQQLLAATRGLAPPFYKRPRAEREAEEAADGGSSQLAGPHASGGRHGSGGGREGNTLGASRGPAALQSGGKAPAAVPWMMTDAERLASEAVSTTGADPADETAASKPSGWLSNLQTAPVPAPAVVGQKRKEPMPGLGSSSSAAIDATTVKSEPVIPATQEEEPGEEDEEEMVMIQGVPKPLSEVTEEDQERMTKEEFDIFCALVE